MPYIGIPEWIIVNATAVIGITIGYLKPTTKLPHMGHVLLSTWASLFGFTAFAVAGWIPILPLSSCSSSLPFGYPAVLAI